MEHKPERRAQPYYLTALVQMSTTDKTTLDAVLDVLRLIGVKGAGYTYQEKDPARHRDSWHLRVHRLRDIQVLAQAMLPHAVTKCRHWEIMLAYTTSRLSHAGGKVLRGPQAAKYTDQEVAWAIELHNLNLRGPAAVQRAAEWGGRVDALKGGDVRFG